MNNNTYLKNTALLFAAMAVTKIVGAIFKIPLANILGGTGMGYFSTAYSIYSPVFALTAAGVPTVMMRLTAQNLALGRPENARKTKNTAIALFTFIGAMGTLLILLASGYFSEHIARSPQSRPAIIAIAPAVLFCCIASVIRGYYEGMSNVMPTVAANVTEAVSRAIVGLALSFGIIAAAKYCFDNGIAFLGQYYTSYSEAYSAALPWAAAAAITAVTISEVCGFIALLIHDRHCRRISQPKEKQATDRKRKIVTDIIRSLLPVAAFALVMNCFSFVDLLTVTGTIDNSLQKHPDFYARAFRTVFESGITADEMANFMYGSYTGIAMSLFMLIPSFAGMTEKTIIPEITAAWEHKDKASLQAKTELLLRTSALIGCPTCFGAAALAEPILTLLYPTRAAEVSVCVNCFAALCAGGMLMIITSAMSGVFQAIGKAHLPLIIMTCAVILKLILNPILIAVPRLNISGAALSTALCYAAAGTASLILGRYYVGKMRLLRCFATPLSSALCCALTASAVYQLLPDAINQPCATLISVISGGFVYVLLLILTGSFRTSLIIKQRKPKKSEKGLAKTQKIG